MVWVIEVEHPYDGDDRRDAEYSCDTWTEATERWEDLTGQSRFSSAVAMLDLAIDGVTTVEYRDIETGRTVRAREVDGF